MGGPAGRKEVPKRCTETIRTVGRSLRKGFCLSLLYLRGATAGVGLQLVDPIGVRVVPEVRYTRWFGSVFDNRATRSRPDQVEFVLSLTF